MASEPPPRKIVHVDMDAFYASVEQRDDASLRGRPVVVAWRGHRSVVCAASYEARQFGIHSAMPALRAARLCPRAVFVPPDFPRYRKVSRQVREIFSRHTTLIEPLSLDEAYLDVTADRQGLGSATAVATAIRQAIRDELSLTASAGIASNKFLAKIASDWRKPDGQFVIRPGQVEAFLTPLPVRKIPGVGKVLNGKLGKLGIRNVGELRARPLAELQQRFGNLGLHLYRRARGIDDSAVVPNRPVQSISAEDTLADDRPLADLPALLAPLAHKVWQSAARHTRRGRTVVLKLKTSEFRILTRSQTPPQPPANEAELLAIGQALFSRVDTPAATRFRLLGIGLSNFQDEASPQPGLFQEFS